MHNLGTVLRFEFLRTIKKPSFWISILVLPAIVAVVVGITLASGQRAKEASEKANKESFSIAVKDDSRLVTPQLIKQYKISPVESRTDGINMVKNGEVEAFFYYPANPSKKAVEVYGKDVGLVKNSRYSEVAQIILKQAATAEAGSPEVASLLSNEPRLATTTFKDGQETAGFMRVVAPGIFLLLFYFAIVMLSGQMLTSTTEEKENRVTEMILTTIKAKTLVIGKILSILATGLLQALVVIVPAVIGYLLFGDNLSIPAIDLSKIEFQLAPMVIGAVLFICSFMLFTGLLVAIGAAVPTAKEANQFLGFVFILLFVPLYAAQAIVTDPTQLIVKVFSFFPLTSPITLLLRNAVGNLSPLEATIGVGILVISGVAAVTIAIRIFQFGTVEYSRRLSAKEILARK